MTKLKKARLLKGYTIEKVATDLGITKQRYYQIEIRGLERCSERNTNNLCEYFGVSNKFDLIGIDIMKVVPKTKEEWESFERTIKETKKKQGIE
jgi:transcriptional regulator with XRE-family HTH domain